MKRKLRKILITVVAAVFLFSTGMAIRQGLDRVNARSVYEQAASIAVSEQTQNASEPSKQPQAAPDRSAQERGEDLWIPAPVAADPVMEELEQINLDALRKINGDVLGWIYIPDTEINYPLLQGEDNDYYLEHTWDKQRNTVGSIFLEHQNSADLSDFNTVIYGHNMGNGSMFAGLQNYAMEDYWKTHPYVYIVSDEGVYRYEVFAFNRAQIDGLTYGLKPERTDTKEKMLNEALESSWIKTAVEPAVTDRILTLSTCTGADYSARYVVQARLIMKPPMA